MKTLHKAEGELRPDVNDTVRLVSELLLYNTSLGRGYDAQGMDDMKGWVITSAIHPEAHCRLTEGSNAFLASVSERDRELKKKVADLETAKKSDGRIGGQGPLPFRPHHTLETPDTESLSDLKEQAAQLSFPLWRENNPSKNTLIEVMVRSRYGALTFVDDSGARAGLYTASRRDFLHDVGCLTLTQRQNDDTAFVRSSSTGGASIHSLAGKATSTKFTWLICPDVRLAKGLGKMIDKKTHASAARGNTLLLPVPAADRPDLTFSSARLERAFKQVFALGEHGKTRIPVKWGTEELQREWDSLLREPVAQFIIGDLSDTGHKRVQKNLARPTLIVGAAARAMITYRILGDSKDPSEILLDLEDMERLRYFLDALVYASSGLSELDAKAEQASVARAARLPSPERFMQLKQSLAKAITASEHGMVTRRQALKLPGMTIGTLASLAQDGLFIEVTGKHNIKQGTARTAYAFREDTRMDPEEVADEYMASLQEYDDDPNRGTHVNSDAVKLLTMHLQDEARKNNVDPLIGIPVVQIDTLTREQIQDLPYAIEKLNTTPTQDVFVRGGPERLGMNKEPEHLFEGDDENPAPLRRDVVNVWFRTNAQGTSYRNWGISNLNFQWWGEGKDAIKPLSEGGDDE